MENYTYGIDVSRWQGAVIDWDKVKNAGKSFVIIKVTEGLSYKMQFIEIAIQQAIQSKAAGFKVGYYHYAHPVGENIESDAASEASYFLNTLQRFPKSDFPLVLDLEDEEMKLLPDETVKWITSFQLTINKSGFELMLYGNKGFLDEHLPLKHSLGNIPLWIAYYPKKFDINQLPSLANGWNSFAIWQYSEVGQISGISGNQTDLNIMNENVTYII